MSAPFTNLDQAREYARAIENRIERVWTEYCLSHAVGALVHRHNAREAGTPVDLLTHVQLVRTLVADPNLLASITSGSFEHFEDIPDTV